MAKPNALILRSPGTNCDEETAYAFEMAGANAESVHVNRLLAEPGMLKSYQVICVPGGFSFGDDISGGKVLALQLQHNLADALGEFHGNGNLILGICNGFQVLLKSGLLIRNEYEGPAATLTWNDSGRYRDSWVHLAIDSELCVFLNGIDQIELPIAHAEGKFVSRNSQLLDYLEVNHQLAIRYCKPTGPNGQVPFPSNPNGSVRDVAGICDDTGRVFGLMPHPERFADATNHPNWTRTDNVASQFTGLKIFENAVGFFA